MGMDRALDCSGAITDALRPVMEECSRSQSTSNHRGHRMSFTICYSYKAKRVVTKLAVDHLTPYAAVCYVLLQCGATGDSHQNKWPTDYNGIVKTAHDLGITGISFHRSLGAIPSRKNN